MSSDAIARVRRAIRPGASARSRSVSLGIVALLAAATIAAAVLLALPGGGQAAAAKYGGLPAWLPTPSQPVGRVVTASAAHPWLAIEGDTVRVDLAGGQVTATAVGPQVPEEGEFPVPPTSPCSFTVTFTAAAGVLPLRAAAFSTEDEHGNLHRLTVRVAGGGAVPASVAHGHTVTLIMSAVLPTGSGTLRWIPAGTQPIVSWDFDVEID